MSLVLSFIISQSKMEGRLVCFLLMILLLGNFLYVTSRPLASHNGLQVHLSGSSEFSKGNSKEDLKGAIMVEEISRGVSKIGSSPPTCNHKCYGCTPCEAIQVPTTKKRNVGLQYANYEPEGWKCKCGPTFYSP